MSIKSKLHSIIKQGYIQKVITKSELAKHGKDSIKREFADMVNEIVEANTATGNSDMEVLVVINEGDLNPTLR